MMINTTCSFKSASVVCKWIGFYTSVEAIQCERIPAKHEIRNFDISEVSVFVALYRLLLFKNCGLRCAFRCHVVIRRCFFFKRKNLARPRWGIGSVRFLASLQLDFNDDILKYVNDQTPGRETKHNLMPRTRDPIEEGSIKLATMFFVDGEV